MILIPSATEVQYTAGGFGLIGVTTRDQEPAGLRQIGEILPDVLARYGISPEREAAIRRSVPA